MWALAKRQQALKTFEHIHVQGKMEGLPRVRKHLGAVVKLKKFGALCAIRNRESFAEFNANQMSLIDGH